MFSFFQTIVKFIKSLRDWEVPNNQGKPTPPVVREEDLPPLPTIPDWVGESEIGIDEATWRRRRWIEDDIKWGYIKGLKNASEQ